MGGHHDKTIKYKATVTRHANSWQFKDCKARAYWIQAEGEGEPECVISLPNLCCFLAPRDRPVGWNDHDDDVVEHTESSSSGSSEDEDDKDCSDDESNSQGKQPKAKRQKVAQPAYKKTPKGTYEVSVDDLIPEERRTRIAVEAAAGKWNKKANDWHVEPEGWHKSPGNANQ